MEDEFVLLRPVILFFAGAFVLGVVILACHQATEQRTRLDASSMAPANVAKGSSKCPVKPVAACRTVPAESFSAGPAETLDP